MPTRGKDAITLLKEDHKKVRGLLSRLEKTTERASETREELFTRIQQEIQIHTTIEEEIFYPAYKAAVSKREDSKLYQEALEEHHVADVVLAELAASDPQTEVFSAKAKVLKELIEHHAEEEEKQMFPRARREMEPSELTELGTEMQKRKKELEAANEGWIPAASKLVAAVADRLTPASSRSRSQKSAAARGASSRKRATKTSTGRSRPKKTGTTTRARGKSAKARSKK